MKSPGQAYFSQCSCDSASNSPSLNCGLTAMICCNCFEDAENFEPRDVKPAPRHQWDGEDEEQDTAADVRMCFHLLENEMQHILGQF